MLPARHKLSSPADFSRTIKGGRKAGSRTVVVHVLADAHITSPASFDANGDGNENANEAAPKGARGTRTQLTTPTGPRFGLVVSKAVGNAVVRHRTSRRLRHVCRSFIDKLPPGADVVVRALPRSGSATSAQLEADMAKALNKACRK